MPRSRLISLRLITNLSWIALVLVALAFAFDAQVACAQPTIEMSPVNGEVIDPIACPACQSVVSLEGTNFSPSSLITISVDGIEIQTTTALSDGSFSTSFNFPTADFIVCDTDADGEVSSDDISAILATHGTMVDHLVEAKDETGLFDLSVFTRRVAMDDANICTAQCTTPVCAAEVSLSVADSPDPVNVGRDLTYTLRVNNRGPSTATDAKVTNTLPANVNFVRADGCSGSGRTVTCTLGNLVSDQVVRRSITVRPTAPVRLRNTATVTANEPDPRPGNNRQTTETRVNP
jgi:uncharacterized repeat protein (TIGR01451 family)